MLRTTLPSSALSLLLLAPAAGAQMNGTVGPHPAPLGCEISITVSNDTPGGASTSGCPFTVLDDDGALVFDPGCPPLAIFLGSFGWFTTTWDQTDQSGQQVPPGRYWVRVTYDVGPPTMHPVDVGGTDAGLVHEGTMTVGVTTGGDVRNFYLCSPQDPGATYLLLASFSATTGIPTCAGTFPLDHDPLLALTASGGSPIVRGLGVLNGAGVTRGPELPLPPDASLVGVAVSTAYAVLDATAPCPIRRVSEPYTTTIVG